MSESYRDISDRAYRAQLARVTSRVSLAAFSMFLPGYIAAALFIPGFSWGLVVADGIAIILTLSVLWVLRRNLDVGVGLYLFTASGALFATLAFTGGMRSAIVTAIPVVAWIAGVLGGRRTAMFVVVLQSVVYITLVILEFFGLYVPNVLPESIDTLFWVAIFIVASVMALVINEQFKRFSQLSLAAIRDRNLELAEAQQRAEQLRKQEREARQQEEAAAQELFEIVKQYVDFLNRISAGEYDARLDIPSLEEADSYVYRQLISLGRALNVTVDSLVSALNEVRLAQEAYVQRSWENVVRAAAAPTGYQYRDDDVEIAEDAWLPAMQAAVNSKELETQVKDMSGEVAVPIGWRDSVIGVLGMRREAPVEWNEDELAIINAVTVQLAQTIENLRLLDATTRQATQERVSGEIAGRIREEIDLEAVLERALSELGQALDADRAVAHLSLAESQEMSSVYSTDEVSGEDSSQDQRR